MVALDTCEEWGRAWPHLHPELMGSSKRSVAIRGRIVVAWSLFRDGIRPEWEHPANEGGVTLFFRSVLTSAQAVQLWTDLVVECVRGAVPDGVVGVLVSKRPANNGNVFIKSEVWTRGGSTGSDGTPGGDSGGTVAPWLHGLFPAYDFVPTTRN